MEDGYIQELSKNRDMIPAVAADEPIRSKANRAKGGDGNLFVNALMSFLCLRLHLGTVFKHVARMRGLEHRWIALVKARCSSESPLWSPSGDDDWYDIEVTAETRDKG